MQDDRIFRYEKKYLIHNLQVENYRARVEQLCRLDAHAGEKGSYCIRSLYFDDYQNSAFEKNERGIDLRDKWRFRIYNCNDGVIRLEHKIKIKDKVHKDYAMVSKAFYEAIMNGEQINLPYPTEDRVLNQFLFDYFTKGLKPAVIVEYVREPYVFEEGDVRVTFDLNIAYSGECERFLDPDLPLIPLTGAGRQLLEVKYTEFLPSVIHNALNMGVMQQTTFSKFYLSVRNERMRGIPG